MRRWVKTAKLLQHRYGFAQFLLPDKQIALQAEASGWHNRVKDFS